jgi:hypothetical protein
VRRRVLGGKVLGERIRCGALPMVVLARVCTIEYTVPPGM